LKTVNSKFYNYLHFVYLGEFIAYLVDLLNVTFMNQPWTAVINY